MKRIFLLWLLLGSAYLCCAQTVTIVDRQTEKPIEGAMLISQSPWEYVVTNAEGQADISVFKKVEQIQLRALGYQTEFTTYKGISDSKFRISLNPLSLDLDHVVISAAKWHQVSENVPAKIISISPEEVALQNPQTAADLLGISGKVFIQKSQQGGGSPMIRGFSANRLIYTVDGVRMNTAIFRSGNLQNVINIDPFAVENTEVLFGPGSVIYGSDAIGGVMSFQTLTPQFSLTDTMLVNGKAVARYSSANKEKTGHFDVNLGWKKWSSVTSFSVWDYEHLRQGSKGPEEYLKKHYVQRKDGVDEVITQDDLLLQIPSAYSQMNLMQKVRFKPNDKWDFEYGFHYSNTSSYGRYDRHNRYRNGAPRYAEWSYGPQKWMMNKLSVNHGEKNVLYDKLNINLAWQSFEESRIERSLNNPERSTQTEYVEAYSANLDLVKSTGAKNSLFYGAEYVFNEVVSNGRLTGITSGIELGGPSRYPHATWMSIAAYVNDEFRATDKLTLQAGLRYNYILLDADFSNNLPYYPFPFSTAQINTGALTGSLGGVYRPSAKWTIRANFGTAFRSPNVDDLGKVFDSEPGTVTVPNADLKPEYGYNVDLGLAKVFGKSVKLELTGYYTLLENAMVRRNYELAGEDSIPYNGTLSRVQAIQNAAVAHVYGIQAGIEIKLPAGFTFLSDLNYQAGEEELDDGTVSASRHAAPLFGVSRLRYKNRNITLELNAIYQGKRSFENLAKEEQGKDEIYAKDANGNNYAPSWYTLNLKALYRINKTFTVSGGVENITDQRYRPYSSGISGSGRNFILSLRADF